MKKIYREIITGKSNKVVIDSVDQELIEHFEIPSNYADFIISQINDEHLYDFILKDRNDLVVLDIGANIGLFALYANDIAKSIHCLEPTPSHFNLLCKLTAPYKNIIALNQALHDTKALVDFYMFDQNSTMNSTVNKYGSKIQVQGTTLFDLLNDCNLDHVDFVKCDIEGSEMAAITIETVKAVTNRIDKWFLEIHATQNGSIASNREHIKKIFEYNDYKTVFIKQDGILVYK